MRLTLLCSLVFLLTIFNRTNGTRDKQAASSSSTEEPPTKKQRIEPLNATGEQYCAENLLLITHSNMWQQQSQMAPIPSFDQVYRQLEHFKACEKSQLESGSFESTSLSKDVNELMEMFEIARAITNDDNAKRQFCSVNIQSTMQQLEAWQNKMSHQYPLMQNFVQKIYDQITSNCIEFIGQIGSKFLENLNESQRQNAMEFYNEYKMALRKLTLLGLTQTGARQVEGSKLAFAEAAAKLVSKLNETKRSDWNSQISYQQIIEFKSKQIMSQICNPYLVESPILFEWKQAARVLNTLHPNKSLVFLSQLLDWANLSDLCKIWFNYEINTKAIFEAHQRMHLTSDGMDQIHELHKKLIGSQESYKTQDAREIYEMLCELRELYEKQNKFDRKTSKIYAINMKELETLLNFANGNWPSAFLNELIAEYKARESNNIVIYLEQFLGNDNHPNDVSMLPQ